MFKYIKMASLVQKVRQFTRIRQIGYFGHDIADEPNVHPILDKRLFVLCPLSSGLLKLPPGSLDSETG